MTEKDAALVKRYLRGECTPEETAKVEAWYNQQLRQRTGLQDEADYARHFVESFEIIQQTKKATPVKRLRWLPYAAASLIFALVGTWLFFGDKIINRQSNIVNIQSADIAPGGNKATLTLSDGRTIDLNQAQTGIAINDDQVIYNDGSQEIVNLQSSIVNRLTLTTPKGGTYSITLADGTEVWLNAASTLKYPSAFTGDERVVELEGEGYFAVAKDAHRLFKVISNGQEVEVLGTEFNVSAYADETEIKTTLVEGKVKVSNLRSQISDLLTPGTQSIIRGAATDVRNVGVEQYTAWKDGTFYFDGTDSQTAFGQLSRWYDLEVEYQGNIPAVRFYGVIERDKSLVSVLGILAEAGLRFRVEKTDRVNKLIVINE